MVRRHALGFLGLLVLCEPSPASACSLAGIPVVRESMAWSDVAIVGTVIDLYPPGLHLPELLHLCWAHLKRDFKQFLDYGPEAKRLGERLLAQRNRLFKLWHRHRDGTLSRLELQLASKAIRVRIIALLEEGEGLSSKKVRGMCHEMLKLRESLFTFIDVERVEPTNNAAEQAVRFAVLMRKGCFGSDSARGSRFIERFLTARATLRRQKRDLYSFLKDACAAAMNGTQAPSLLPAHARAAGQIAAAA